MIDKVLKEKVQKLQNEIKNWAVNYDLWNDAGFQSYAEYFDDEPNENAAIVTLLITEGGLYSLFNGGHDELIDEFDLVVKSNGFWYEKYNHYIIEFYADDEQLNQQYLDYFEWEWICGLIKPNYTSLYNELFEYFQKHPDRLYNIHDRQFEILISEIFKNQGYYTELGPGRSDSGVDVRLYQKDDIDQIVTLVQAKKYKKTLPIKLEAVASLKAIVDQENANRGLFITTSRYLPGVKKFAAREKSKLILADSNDVTRWCNTVSTNIVRDKSNALNDQYLLGLVQATNNTSLIGKVVIASVGYGMIDHDFCIIVYDSPNAVLLMRLPWERHSSFDPPYNTRGLQVPIIDSRMLKNKNKENVFRAKKITNDNDSSFLGQLNYYKIWDQKPVYYDHND